jgi:hypothetical protein
VEAEQRLASLTVYQRITRGEIILQGSDVAR